MYAKIGFGIKNNIIPKNVCISNTSGESFKNIYYP